MEYKCNIFFTEQQHRDLYEAVHHKDSWTFIGADADWDASYDRKTGKIVYDKESVGLKNMRFGDVAVGPFLFAIEPTEERNFICVFMHEVWDFPLLDSEDWRGGVRTAAILDFQPEDVTKDRDETLNNLMERIISFLDNAIIENEVPAKKLVQIQDECTWKRYF